MSGLFGAESAQPSRVPTRFARVAVERGLDRTAGRAGSAGAPASSGTDGTLTYSADDEAIQPGDRVMVPLGRGDKPTPGIVVRTGGAELLDGFDVRRVKSVAARTGRALPPGLLPLAEWLAGYYVCPLGMVLSAMMPAAVKKRTGTKAVQMLRLARGPSAESAPPAPEGLSKALLRAWGTIQSANVAWPVTAAELAASLPGISRQAVKKLLEAGLLTSETVESVGDGELQAAAEPGMEPEPDESAQPDASAHQAASATTERFTLTPEQSAAVTGISAAGTLDRFGVHLLLGITGSGKTEVYLRVLEAVLARPERPSAIVLVPEIALTPQTAGRFTRRFSGATGVGGGGVAVLHSGLTATQRHAQWLAAAEGRVRVVVGARSAVFAPLPRVGLIVVDEEHDSSYKQDQLPRYHARDVAIKRAQLAGCPVLLGSATPALESYANAIATSDQGGSKYALWRLTTRATGASLPQVEIVDLAQERRDRAASAKGVDRHVHLLGPRLEHALERTLADGHQAVLLLNRRGYANYICCPDQRCGWLMHCDDCDATMVYHKAATDGSHRGFVRCHHCLAEQLLPANCPACGKKVNTFGEGTQRLEDELERKFADPFGLRIGRTLLRLDSDTMRSARDYFAALDAFARGRARVLVGTQMIAKGLDFPGVRLVGVVNADTALAMPDFRASERTYQLVSQVAGRAGRGGPGSVPGLVIVQTMSPRADAIVRAAAHDYEGFAKSELATRARAGGAGGTTGTAGSGIGLPPAGRMARVVCRDLDAAKAQKAAGELAAAIRFAATEAGIHRAAFLLRGPLACPFARIAQHHRWEVQLLARTRGVIQTLLQSVRRKGLLTSDAHTAVDVDPVSLL
jgi:primosomal protein N' (replication factor Y)